MAIDFPDSPSVNDTFTAGGKVYQWDGTVWEIYGPNVSPGTFKIDDANNRVGIGTATPEYSLHVDGDVGFNDAATANFFVSSGTGADVLPSGTTAQRPANAGNGMIRYNSTDESVEAYIDGSWITVKKAFSAIGGTITTSGGYTIHTFTTSGSFEVLSGSKEVEYLIIAGGGGGGHNSSPPQFSGGGAGGVLQGSLPVTVGLYGIAVGAGGVARSNGANSTAFGLTAIGGGYGGGGGGANGGSGGSGGGQGGTGAASLPNGQTRASGTPGQGNSGGAAVNNNSDAAGGGGGFSSAGQDGTTSTSGNGGAGLTSTISGASVNYAGGGGRTDQGYRGGYSGAPNAIANSGSGGAGTAGNGASGIVIIRYAI